MTKIRLVLSISSEVIICAVWATKNNQWKAVR